MVINEITKKYDFVLWLCENYQYLDSKRKPKIKHLVYIEQLINGVGVQTDLELFELYMKAWKGSDRLKYFYNPDLDCIDYCIDNCLMFRKYDYGCIV